MKRILLALLVAIATGVVVYILGVVIGLFFPTIGGVIMGISWLLGLVAGIWYYVTGSNPIL